MKKTLTVLSAFIISATNTFGQAPFNTKEYVDIGNIKAAMLLHGDMNWDVATQSSQCEFPKGSGIHLSTATSVWMGGYDNQNQLRISSQTYRQTGNDFWPGPLDNNGSLNLATSTQWARIWKVNFIEISQHISNTNRSVNNTPPSILEWPAKGNPYAKGNNGASLTIATDMAPFVDVNSDGSYDPLSGDYPDIKGDQMLWWVFSDNGPTHNNTASQTLQVEVHAKVYAYSRGTTLDNIVFYEMDIHNRSASDYPTFRLAISADMDLGYFNDDYIGFDSSRRLGYVYNGATTDGAGQLNAYGTTPPIAGYTFLKMPGDNGTNFLPAGSFMTFNNDNSVAGNPQNATEFYNYMTSRFRDGKHLNNDFAGKGVPSFGRGSGPQANYIFPGDPADTTAWSECNSYNPTGDRRFVLSTGDISLVHNSKASIAFALVTTERGANNTCPGVDITGIKDVTDTAWKYFQNPPSGRLTVQDIALSNSLQLHPNPTTNLLHIGLVDGALPADAALTVYDITGRKMNVSYSRNGNTLDADVSALPAGVYNIRLGDAEKHATAVFVKQ
ncbi:MAG TPA: T9SS type A sorting domain-containing protein [Flavipsychrobacter sp.]